jgi:hypothetical protein
MPHNDYFDPELRFPRLEVRCVRTDNDAFHLQVWKWTKAAERESRPLFNGKRAGSFADIQELVRQLSKKHNIQVDADDWEWPDY